MTHFCRESGNICLRDLKDNLADFTSKYELFSVYLKESCNILSHTFELIILIVSAAVFFYSELTLNFTGRTDKNLFTLGPKVPKWFWG